MANQLWTVKCTAIVGRYRKANTMIKKQLKFPVRQYGRRSYVYNGGDEGPNVYPKSEAATVLGGM